MVWRIDRGARETFARTYGFSVASVRDRELGRRQPERAARILLAMIGRGAGDGEAGDGGDELGANAELSALVNWHRNAVHTITVMAPKSIADIRFLFV